MDTQKHRLNPSRQNPAIAVVETKAEILAVLTPLGLARPHDQPFADGPPRPEVAVLVDAASGAVPPFAPPDLPPGLPYPQARHEAIRFHAEVMEPAESFDQTGFEPTPVPLPAGDRSGQQELFSDDSYQSDAADREPAFWPEDTGQHQPNVEYFQPDAPE